MVLYWKIHSLASVLLLVGLKECKSLTINIAKNATLQVSSTLDYLNHDFKKANAVDGLVELNADACGCCYSSALETSPFFQASFTQPNDVLSIVLEGRKSQGDELSFLSALRVLLDGQTVAVNYTRTTNTAVVHPTSPVQDIKVERPSKENDWYLFICEIRVYAECPHGHFGEDCFQQCHCHNDSDCDDVTGKCYNNLCAPGWTTESCNEACDFGSFGLNCSDTCHCRDISPCNNVNGTCENGLCKDGWLGSSCSQACNHGAFGLNCSSNCYCRDNSPCNNVDGTCDNGLCEDGWRNISCSQACEFQTFGTNCTDTCYCLNNTQCDNVNGSCYDGLCEPGWSTYSCSAECSHGTFGLNCSSHCHCRDNSTCNTVNGTCDNGLCDDGWRGDTCSQKCDHRKFGVNCSTTCHCLGNLSCHHVNGMCEDGLCEAGFEGSSCNKECDERQFGLNCSQTCNCLNRTECDNIKGTCKVRRCDPGYQGDSCSEPCDSRTFGTNCSSACHCLGNSNCGHIDGICETNRCDPGFQGLSCSKECDERTFGMNCSRTCYCFNKTACNNINGKCMVAKCDPGYHGNACSEPLTEEQTEGSSSGAAVGAGIGTAIIVLAVVVLAVVVYRKRRKPKHDAANTRPVQANRASTSPNQEQVEIDDQEDTPVVVEGSVNIGFIDDDSTYYNMRAASSGIRLNELWNYIRRYQEKANTLFYEEFKTLPYGLVHPYEESQKPENRKKNRYRDMYAYDHSRVILEVSGPGETDYINACHIDGYDTARKFIASQGPTDVMIDDFWRMIWQQKVENIIMLTNPIETGGVKCVQYWPEEEEEAYGAIHVTLIETDEYIDYIRRVMVIKRFDGQEREVTQFHFKSWPDKDVPDSTFSLVNFWRAANENDSNNPILVHCSAGIGRTGTYIALDILYNQMKAERGITPLKIVQNLRKQRVNMVQTKDQYVYLHEAVAEACGIGTHSIWSSQFQAVYDYMSERGEGSSQTRLEDQFDMVVASLKTSTGNDSNVDSSPTQSTSRMLESHAYKPSARHSGSKHLQECDAIYMPSYSGKRVFLVAKSPTDMSLAKFWSLVEEESVKTIISLCDTSAQNQQVCYDMGGDNFILNGGLTIDIIEERRQPAFTERTFNLTGLGKGEESRVTVKVFSYAAWQSDHNVPGDVSTLLDLLDAVHVWQPHLSESSQIVIHCLNGAKRSGIVCLVLNELQRMDREGGQINILDSLMRMKTRNSGVIHNAEQLRYCYDVILAFIQRQQNQNIYANM